MHIATKRHSSARDSKDRGNLGRIKRGRVKTSTGGRSQAGKKYLETHIGLVLIMASRSYGSHIVCTQKTDV